MTERTAHFAVECPQCGTRFRACQEDLAAAQGRLRCGACLQVFRVLEAPPTRRRGLGASFPAWVVVGLVLALTALAVQVAWLQTGYRARNLEISRHAESPGALAVQFVVLHDARIPAPFPAFDIEFATIGGEPVGSRRFRPGDYLEAEPPQAEWRAHLRLLNPETAHPVTVTVPHPGAAAAQVTISFPSRSITRFSTGFTMSW
ncbi:MAG: DUF3426 domain-containing protein [Gammaproteobacteria bacterium]|nr:DUF3426 domain-containing protein [Gammaproteobacteria bacterium]